MKPPDAVRREIVAQWLARADEDLSVATALSGAVQLTDYGVDVRYPGDLPQLDSDDARRAVDHAVEVRDAITSRLASNP